MNWELWGMTASCYWMENFSEVMTVLKGAVFVAAIIILC